MKKPKLCKVCKEPFYPHNSLTPICSYKCYEIWTSEKEVKKRVKEMKANLQTHSDYCEILQKLVNQIARVIDTHFPCVSSKRTTGQMHGGHLYSVGAHPEIRFNLLNIWKQSAIDNTFKSGNINDYRANIQSLFGESSYYILDLKDNAKPLKLSISELIDKMKIAKQIIKEQASGEHIAKSQEDRLIIRINLNKRLGIYR